MLVRLPTTTRYTETFSNTYVVQNDTPQRCQRSSINSRTARQNVVRTSSYNRTVFRNNFRTAFRPGVLRRGPLTNRGREKGALTLRLRRRYQSSSFKIILFTFRKCVNPIDFANKKMTQTKIRKRHFKSCQNTKRFRAYLTIE